MKFKVVLLSVLLSAGVVSAQTTDNVDQRWKDAQQRLNEAAREIADLSSQRIDIQGLLSQVDERRAMLGVNIDSDSAPGDEGVRVLGVSPGGPADEAGLQSGDVILKLNHSEVSEDKNDSPVEVLLSLMGDVEPGDVVEVEYLRGKQVRTTQVETEEFSPRMFSFRTSPGQTFSFNTDDFILPDNFSFRELTLGRWGDLSLVKLSEDLGEYFGVKEGLLVVHAPKSEDLGLKDGDVILSIDKRVPEDPRHAMRILRSYRAGEPVSIEIVRKQKNQTLDLELPERSAASNKKRFFMSPDY